MLVNVGNRQLAPLHAIQHGIHVLTQAARHQQQVVARLQGLQAECAGLADALHGQCIGEHQSAKAQLVAQQSAYHVARERRGPSLLRLQHGHFQVPHHHAAQSGTYGLAEGIEFDAVQPLPAEGQRGQGLVRVHVRIAVAGKVLAHRQHTAVFQPTGIGQHLARHVSGVFAEGTGVDDRIARIDIDVGHRGKVDLHAQLAALARYFQSVLVEQRVVGYATQHHVAWKGGRTLQAHGQSPLAVEGHQQRYVGHLLCLVGQRHLFIQLSARE